MDCWKNCRTCAGKSVINVSGYGDRKCSAQFRGSLDLCGTTLRLTALNSQYAGDVAAISAKACESCAEICGKVDIHLFILMCVG